MEARHEALRSVDLNLLVALDALLEERNVTRAAERLELRQPTLSASLRRLRDHFGDDLLRRRGNRYELTPFAVELQPLVTLALMEAERVFAHPGEFDPMTSRREFGLLASDYWLADLGALLLEEVRRRAPGVRLRLGDPLALGAGETPDALKEWDFVVAAVSSLPGLSEEPSLSTRLVCIVDADNPSVGEELTVGDLERLPWVVVASSPAGFHTHATSFALGRFAARGVTPRIVLTTQSALSVPALVAGTDCIALIRERFANSVAERLGLRVFDPPVPVPDFAQSLFWHPRRERDPGHAWMRGVLHEVARTTSPARRDDEDPG